MAKRICMLTRYSAKGASSRLRSIQYVPLLESNGFDVSIKPLFNDVYLRDLYSGKRKSIFKLLWAYCRRLLQIISIREFDIIWIEKELFPYLPGVFENLIQITGVPYIVDYDDAIPHNYDGNAKPIVRLFLSGKLKSLISNAHLITVGNSYLAELVKIEGAKKTVIIPTAIDSDKYQNAFLERDATVRIGWIGTPQTQHYLNIVLPALEELSKYKEFVLVTIGAHTISTSGFRVDCQEWHEHSEVKSLDEIDIGIMPLNDNPWDNGKCGYKLIQYMALGKPVVASPVGVNKDIISEKNGFFAITQQDWFDALFALLESPDLRDTLGKNGQLIIKNEYTTQISGKRILSILDSLAPECLSR